MSKLWKGGIILASALLWLAGVWFFVENAEPTPAEIYAEWLVERRSPSPPSFLENVANRVGIRYFSEVRIRADLRRTGELLGHADYAVAAASWQDTAGRSAPGAVKTWPHLSTALANLLREENSKSLTGALARTDAAGFSSWELTLARSAFLSGSSPELASLLLDLRAFQDRIGLDASRSDSLEKVSQLYPQSAAEFGKELARAEGPAATKTILSVMNDRRIAPAAAYFALLGQWKAGSFDESDWEAARGLAGDGRLGTLRMDYLSWLLLGQGGEAFRTEHREWIRGLLGGLQYSEPALAKDMTGHLVREISKKDAELSGDWAEILGILLAEIDQETDLKLWIHDRDAPDFIWLCRHMGEEGLLARAVGEWAADLNHPWIWIGEFIDSRHYAAVCALIERSTTEIVSIRSRKETYEEEKSRDLAHYESLIKDLTSHTETAQVKGFIHLLVAIRAMENLRDKPDEEASRAEVLHALAQLNEAETVNPSLLKQTASHLLELDPEFFEAGRPSFDRWRNGTDLDAIVTQVVRGTWKPDEQEQEIWENYAAKVADPSDVSRMRDRIEELLGAPPGDREADEAAIRLRQLLQLSHWQKSSLESGNLELAAWVLERMIGCGEAAESAVWMFDRIREYAKKHPEEDETRVLQTLYEHLYPVVARLPLGDAFEWLARVTDPRISGEFAWPEHFSFESGPLNRQDPLEVVEHFRVAFADHPWRAWVARRFVDSIGLRFRKIAEERLEAVDASYRQSGDLWLAEAIAGHLHRSFDADKFVHDMKDAPAAARRFFLFSPIASRKSLNSLSHVSGRPLSEEETLRFILWEADQILLLAEQGRIFRPIFFEEIFHQVFELARVRTGDEEIRSVMKRLKDLELDHERLGFHRNEVESMMKWKARSASFASEGLSEVENLLNTEDLSVTERVWGLARNGEVSEAVRMMNARAGDLTFETPPNAEELVPEVLMARFRAELPEGSELLLYVEVYFARLNLVRKYWNPRIFPAKFWPSTVSVFHDYEDAPRQLAKSFEETKFGNRQLERTLFLQLAWWPGAGAAMPGKLESMRKAGLDDFCAERIPYIEFDAELAKGNFEQMSERVNALIDASSLSGKVSTDDVPEILGYHLWRRAIMGERLTREQRKMVEILSFSQSPTGDLAMRTQSAARNSWVSPNSRSRIRAMHFALQMIEAPPLKDDDEWSWTDFSDLDFERYRFEWNQGQRFLYHAAAVVAAQCRDCDEESKWKLMSLFESYPPGVGASSRSNTFSLFAATGFMKSDEVKRGVRDFVLRHPNHGWNFATVIDLGRQFGDSSLVEFGRNEATRFFDQNPELERSVQQRFKGEGTQ